MFKRLRTDLEYQKIISDKSSYASALALKFFIKISREDMFLSKEQRYMLILKISNSTDAIADLLNSTNTIALDSAERMILIDRLLHYSSSYIITLLNTRFKFLPNELDLIVGNLIRTKDYKSAKYLCQKGVLTTEHYNVLISLGIMNELTSS